jgi:hypothetical protein
VAHGRAPDRMNKQPLVRCSYFGNGMSMDSSPSRVLPCLKGM